MDSRNGVGSSFFVLTLGVRWRFLAARRPLCVGLSTAPGPMRGGKEPPFPARNLDA